MLDFKEIFFFCRSQQNIDIWGGGGDGKYFVGSDYLFFTTGSTGKFLSMYTKGRILIFNSNKFLKSRRGGGWG